ncbi:hypothetical protein IAU59_004170 [Kwoniella sp. CBS 9459]
MAGDMPLTPPPTATTYARPPDNPDDAVSRVDDPEPDIYSDVEESSESRISVVDAAAARTGTNVVITSSETLHILPPSPAASDSSLTSEEVSFDHNAAPIAVDTPAGPSRTGTQGCKEGRAPTLGLRDLVKMHKRDRTRRAMTSKAGSGSGGIYSSNQVQIHDSTSAISLGGDSPTVDPSAVPPYPGDEPGAGVFARQVVIRGWKVVGGSSWTDGGKMGAYVVYDIDIGLRNGGNLNILRRYNDFVRLRSDLLSRYPTLEGAIPPLPGKAHFSRFSSKFLEERQPRLQRFLKAVVLHPEMGKGGTDSVVGRWVMGDESWGTGG